LAIRFSEISDQKRRPKKISESEILKIINRPEKVATETFQFERNIVFENTTVRNGSTIENNIIV
jgi:hypothetical protein